MSRLKTKLAVLGFLALTLPTFAANHVRVILDTSGSMAQNDRSRLATLSTLLLFDLAKPNLSLDDSFAVMPFDRTIAEWKSGPPPAVQGPWIRAVRDHRSDLVDSIRNLKYDVGHTYYFPFLSAAIGDLKQQRHSASDRRVIVLVTDGVPEDPDTGLIQRELLPQLQHENIQLYVLALGPQADSHSREIETAIGETNVGQLFIDKDGTRVVENMIAIFSRSFGYTAAVDRVAGGLADLDLAAQQHPDRVAVVLYWKKPNTPELQLQAPSVAGISNPDGLRTAEETGGSYSVRWVLAPSAGPHRLKTTAEGANVAVLRPASLMVEILPQPASTPIYAAIATTPLPLRVMLRGIGGNQGDPGPVKLWFQVHGPRDNDDYEWSDEQTGATGEGTPTQEGRYFDIVPQFTRNPKAPQPYYHGYITFQVKRGGAVIGELMGENAHHVLVFPWMQISIVPPSAFAGVNGQPRALGPQSMGCASFQFHVEGSLPHPGEANYSVQAVIARNAQVSRSLAEAEYTLDHESLSYGSNSGLRSGDWLTGRSLSKQALLDGQHLVCVVPAPIWSGTLSPATDLSVQFKLLEAPYDSYQAISPFTFKVLLGPPTWTQKYSAWLGGLLALLILALQFWYQRFRPEVPYNLRSSSGNPERGLEPLGAGSLVRRFLGLIVDRPVLLDSGSYTAGWVRPINAELYQFRPARGVTLGTSDHEDAYSIISVNRKYQLQTARGNYQFHLEYE